MDTSLLVILAVLILGFSAVIYILNSKLSPKSEDDSQKILMEWFKQMRQDVKTGLDKNADSISLANKNINDRLDNAARVIGAVSKELGTMSEIGRSMKDLQDFLRSPKLRGNIGEQVLKELLGQMLPKESFHLQYSFKSGEKVDAAIQTENGIIPIDSKFPMENFKKMMSGETEAERQTAQKDFARDVKKHIDNISSKYILPEEQTIDYALMYIPSEAIFYEIMANMPELSDYAHKKRVLPVSPSTFYAYLRAILMSFEGKKIEQQARHILTTLRAVQKDSEKFGEKLRVLSGHIRNASNMSDEANSSFARLFSKISRAQSLKDTSETALPEEIGEQ